VLCTGTKQRFSYIVLYFESIILAACDIVIGSDIGPWCTVPCDFKRFESRICLATSTGACLFLRLVY
jgi:hypothetical protein